MSDTFACPQCGKAYPHAGRKPGKAVVCVCGHRFLVPAPEVRQARPQPPLHPPPIEPLSEPAPSRSPTRPAPATPSVSPRPAAPRPAGPARPSAATPPRAPQPPKEMVAEVVYPGDSAEILPAAEIVSPVPYAYEPPAAMPAAYDPFSGPPLTARPSKRSSTQSSELFGLWAGRVVLFIFVPLGALCVLIGHLQMYRHGGIIASSRSAVTSTGKTRIPAAPAAGSLLAITGAGRTTQNEDTQFTLQFTLSGFVPHPSDQYFWIVATDQRSVEFSIRYVELQQGFTLVGKQAGSAGAAFLPPMRTWIESQPAGSRSRQRVSNEFRF